MENKTIEKGILGERNLYNAMEERKLTLKKIRDKFTQGFSLNISYYDHWEEIKDTCLGFGLELKDFGPLLTINELKYVRLVKKITEDLRRDPRIEAVIIPGIAANVEDFNLEVTKRIFSTIFRVLPEYCLQKSSDDFIAWTKRSISTDFLKELFSLHGTVIDTDEQVNEIVRRIVLKT